MKEGPESRMLLIGINDLKCIRKASSFVDDYFNELIT